MSMRALESVLKLTADTTDFEEKLKKAGSTIHSRKLRSFDEVAFQ